MDQRSERTPLLREHSTAAVPEATITPQSPLQATDRNASIETEIAIEERIAAHAARKAYPIIVLGIVIIFVFDLANVMIQTPLIRVYEEIICRHYFDRNNATLYPSGVEIPENECKIAPVQKELAFIRGMEPVFDAIPSLLVAIPMGMIADNPKIGRKPVILVSVIGVCCQHIWNLIVAWHSGIFPLRMVWLGSIFLIGGGSSVINAILYTMIIDITEPAQRSSIFFTMQLVGSWMPILIGPPITSALMIKSGPWSSLYVGTFFMFVGLAILALFPETMDFKKKIAKDLKVAEPSEQTASLTEDNDGEEATPNRQKLWPQIKSKFSEFVESSSFVFKSPHLIILVCSLMMHMISIIRALETLIYYASTRYGISIAKANLLNTINAAVCIGTLFALPFISTFLNTKWGLTSQRKDLLIAQISVTLFAIGWYIVGLAPTLPLVIVGLVIYTLGSGFSGSVRSLAASYVEAHHQARLSSFIAITMTIGNFLGSPLLAVLYSWGVSTGNPFWYGLPFFGLTVIFGLIGAALWFRLKLPEQGIQVISDDTEEDERD